jgi:hypothetical protein
MRICNSPHIQRVKTKLQQKTTSCPRYWDFGQQIFETIGGRTFLSTCQEVGTPWSTVIQHTTCESFVSFQFFDKHMAFQSPVIANLMDLEGEARGCMSCTVLPACSVSLDSNSLIFFWITLMVLKYRHGF